MKIRMEGYDRTVSNGIGHGRRWKDLSETDQHGGIRLFRVFWNRSYFEQAGISRFPETWGRILEMLGETESSRITPLALHTEGTALAAMLLATAEVAGSEEGAAFMKQLYRIPIRMSGAEDSRYIKKIIPIYDPMHYIMILT